MSIQGQRSQRDTGETPEGRSESSQEWVTKGGGQNWLQLYFKRADSLMADL